MEREIGVEERKCICLKFEVIKNTGFGGGSSYYTCPEEVSFAPEVRR